jgi:NADPH:quinone reductase-like Zn-dependent oxidoreductase
VAACNYKTQDFSEWLQPNKVDLILDPVLGSYFGQNIACLKTEGKWVIYGTLGGSLLTNQQLGPLLMKRATLTFTTLRGRDDEYKARLVNEFERAGVVGKMESGQFSPVVHKVINWRDVQTAHQIIESNENIGKVVLTID